MAVRMGRSLLRFGGAGSVGCASRSAARHAWPTIPAPAAHARCFHPSAWRGFGADDLPTPSGPAGEREPSTKVQGIASQICELTMLEVADLTKVLKDTLDIPDSAMPMGGAMMMATAPAPAAAAETEEEPAEEKTEFDVKLEAFDSSKKIALIKEVRAATSLGLKESKELVENAPKIVAKGLVKDDAEELAAKLTAAGGTAVVE